MRPAKCVVRVGAGLCNTYLRSDDDAACLDHWRAAPPGLRSAFAQARAWARGKAKAKRNLGDKNTAGWYETTIDQYRREFATALNEGKGG